MKRAARTVLTVVLLAAGLVVGQWVPPAPAVAVPETVAREVPLTASLLAAAPRVLAAAPGGVRAARGAETAPFEVCAPIRFTAVAIAWRQLSGRSPHAHLQVSRDGRSYGAPLEIPSAEGPDPGSRDDRSGVRSTDALWVGDGRCIRATLEIPRGVSLLRPRAVFVNTSGTAGVPTRWRRVPGIGAPTFGPAPAAAVARAPRLVSRAAWGANESYRNCDPNYASGLKMAFVHHTATATSYARSRSDDMVRAMYHFHTRVNGWCDIAYNFLVDRYGQVFEGRAGGPSRPVIPAAQQGFNTGATAVAAVGSFGATRPTAAMTAAIARTLAWRLDVAHLPPRGWARMTSAGGPNTKYAAGRSVTLPLISGHRHTGYTSCPGDRLFALLPALRDAVHRTGAPKIFRPRGTTEPILPLVQSARYTATASGPLNWQVDVISSQNQVVRRFTAAGKRLDVSWNGTTSAGLPVLPGTYTVRIGGTSSSGGVARPATFTLTVALL